MVHDADDSGFVVIFDPQRIERMYLALVDNRRDCVTGPVKELVQRVAFSSNGFGAGTNEIEDIVNDTFVSGLGRGPLCAIL